MYNYIFIFFFFNDTATTEIYTLSLHDALPIYRYRPTPVPIDREKTKGNEEWQALTYPFISFVSSCSLFLILKTRPSATRLRLKIDRKSTRLNSSHLVISYAVFCLKKKIHVQLYFYFFFF